jgi:uncharacterized integral membrane protein
MRYFNWVWRAVLLLALLGFSVKNDQQIILRYFLDYQWEMPLMIALLIFFALGALLGVLVLLPNVIRKHREIRRLKREIKLKNKLSSVDETQQVLTQPS